MVSWPRGAAPFAVDELIEAARAIDRAALSGDAGEVVSAQEIVGIVGALTEYVASLPTDQQPMVASGLVAALGERQRFTSMVALKTRALAPTKREAPEPVPAHAELEW